MYRMSQANTLPLALAAIGRKRKKMRHRGQAEKRGQSTEGSPQAYCKLMRTRGVETRWGELLSQRSGRGMIGPHRRPAGLIIPHDWPHFNRNILFSNFVSVESFSILSASTSFRSFSASSASNQNTFCEPAPFRVMRTLLSSAVF